MADLITKLLLRHPDMSGLYRASSEPISKFDLLVQLGDQMGWRDIIIEQEAEFFIDRSLSEALVSKATGWQAPSWSSMLPGLSEEWPKNARLHAA